jgi:hypothetical protein
MADTQDTLAARRWFRQRLEDLGTQYPHLKQPESQERLTEALDSQREETLPCPGNRPGTPEDGPQAPAD